MTAGSTKDEERLSQVARLAEFAASSSLHDKVTVYLKDDTEDHRRGVFCAFIPNSRAEQCLKSPTWDLSIGNGCPGAIQYGLGKGSRTEYFRHGNDDGIEPLILWRDFHGLRDSYVEISEEFRLFHNLFHDRKNDRYLKFDDAGNDQLVATVDAQCVRIRLLEIRQFCAVREMHFALFIDSVEYSSFTLEELGLKKGGSDQTRDLLVFGLHNGPVTLSSKHKSFSRFLGKRLIAPLPKEKSGLPGFNEPESRGYVDFIIEVDSDGNEVSNSSSEAELSNYFGANPGRPHYLTPVFFRKSVLDKYYQQPSKYSVEPGYLRCAGLWGMTIDNHLHDHVVAWLGDLGRDLPSQEQLHWRSFNVPPSGGVSTTFFRQQILAEWADTEHPEHLFKFEYGKLADETQKALGWPVLLPLAKDDEHYFRSLRIPANDEQRDFDEVILALTKILVDSINEREINSLIPAEDLDGLKGSISRLEKACEKRAVPDYANHVRFLRDLQDLRSSGAAHRKGSNYRKIAEKIGIDAQSLREVFEGLLIKGLAFVRFLNAVARSGAFAK